MLANFINLLPKDYAFLILGRYGTKIPEVIYLFIARFAFRSCLICRLPAIITPPIDQDSLFQFNCTDANQFVAESLIS